MHFICGFNYLQCVYHFTEDVPWCLFAVLIGSSWLSFGQTSRFTKWLTEIQTSFLFFFLKNKYLPVSTGQKLFSPSELKLPTTDTVLFYGHFSVLLPELFWSLLKSFTATVPWGRTIGEAEAAPPVPRQGGGQRQDLAQGLQGQSRSSG